MTSRQERISRAIDAATDTQEVVLAGRAVDSVADLFNRMFGDQAAAIIADENTFAIAGGRARAALKASRHSVETFVFPGRPVLHADHENIDALVGWLRSREAVPVAIGAGTVNDVVKRAAFECDRAYLCVATAPSVDGYTSFGAAITTDGFKQTLDCGAPRAVVADLDVLAKSPPKIVVNPTRSANRTDTNRRSETGAGAALTGASGAAHAMQNRAPGGAGCRTKDRPARARHRS